MNEKKVTAVKPFSRYRKVGDLIFVSGQGPLEQGKVVEGNLTERVRKTFENISEILKEENLSLKNVVNVNVYLEDLSKIEEFNEAYKSIVPAPYPARTTVGSFLIKKGSEVEITVIAAK